MNKSKKLCEPQWCHCFWPIPHLSQIRKQLICKILASVQQLWEPLTYMISIKLIPVGESLLPPWDAVQKVISTVWNGGYHFLKTPDEICGGCNFLHKPGIHISHKDHVFIPLPPSISAEKCHRLGDSQIGILGTPGSISRLICVWWKLTSRLTLSSGGVKGSSLLGLLIKTLIRPPILMTLLPLKCPPPEFWEDRLSPNQPFCAVVFLSDLRCRKMCRRANEAFLIFPCLIWCRRQLWWFKSFKLNVL